mgnify:CR=1 FL=1
MIYIYSKEERIIFFKDVEGIYWKKNILLDTNAFIYLMRNEKECSNTISLENRQINESKFYDECKNANYLFITSQTLYEIFWQSIKKTKKIDQFAYYYDQIIKFKNNKITTQTSERLRLILSNILYLDNIFNLFFISHKIIW